VVTNGPTQQQLRNELLPVQVGGTSYEFKYSTRCRVCNSRPELLSLINQMLINGETYSETYRRAVTHDRRKRPITFNSVYTHGNRHLPATSAAVRKAIEERSARLNRDFVEGTENLVDEYVFADVMVKKAFEQLSAEGAQVSARDGLEAAKFLHQMKIGESEGSTLTSVLAQLSQIIEAVRTTVPESMYETILEKLDNKETQPVIEAVPEVNHDDDEYDPVTDDEDDDLE
jgi:hypothetical protein